MSFICSFKMDVAILNLKKKEDRLSKNDLPTCPQLDSGEGSKDSNLYPGILTPVMSWILASQKYIFKSQPLGPHNVTLFRNRVVADVRTLKLWT